MGAKREETTIRNIEIAIIINMWFSTQDCTSQRQGCDSVSTSLNLGEVKAY